ncbi:MAG: hypothetical protein HDKAJFGB_03055 [Anaerolineae bacterium]|nr:hypothetical protein [Anaerolineae bacterium]
MARKTTMKVTYDTRGLELAKQRVAAVLEEGSEIVAQAATRLAPFDPQSRHAKGQTQYPDMHHKDSIRSGKAKSKKQGDKAQAFGEASQWGGTWYVQSTSGRGYWIEKGTKSNERKYSGERETYKKRMAVVAKYGLTPDKKTKKEVMTKGEKRLLTNTIKSLKETGEVVKFKTAKLHAATPARPHLMPAFELAKRYIIQKMKNLL